MTSDNFTITQEEFVQEFRDLKDSLVKDYFDPESQLSRIDKLKKAELTESQIEIVKTLMDDALTDALYTILLGLDGCAAIHQHQITYKLFDEENNEITGGIDIIAGDKFP